MPRSSPHLITAPILGFEGEYRFLSNFEGPGFTRSHIYYQTNEHFYQAWKAELTDDFIYVLGQRTPGSAKKAGRRVQMRADWEQIKRPVMQAGLASKFSFATSRNTEAAQRLLATEGAYLEETNTWGDTYWGVCNGVGENWLGIFLMERREQLGGTGVVPRP